jgi:hypothetical protein
MSGPNLRRADRAMTSEQALRSLERGYAGRLATVSEDGYPYCVPLLYSWADNQVFLVTHRELVEAWTQFRDDESALVAIITGTGEKSFQPAAISSRTSNLKRLPRSPRTIVASVPACSGPAAGPISTSPLSPQ